MCSPSLLSRYNPLRILRACTDEGWGITCNNNNKQQQQQQQRQQQQN